MEGEGDGLEFTGFKGSERGTREQQGGLWCGGNSSLEGSGRGRRGQKQGRLRRMAVSTAG